MHRQLGSLDPGGGHPAQGRRGPLQRLLGGEPAEGAGQPFALRTLEAYNYPAHGYRSKSWDEFAGPDAPVMDVVFTVCDQAAGEACPYWPGQPITAYCGIEDPAAEGSDIEKERAFAQAFRFMKNRIATFLALPMPSLDAVALTKRVQEIGEMEGASRGEANVVDLDRRRA